MNEEITYRVFELNQKIKEVLESSFSQAVWVRGEITGFDRQSKHKNIFFQLQQKDKIHNRLLATVNCLLQESIKPHLRERLIQEGVVKQLREGLDGLEVRLKVRVSVYAPGGRYTLMVEDIDPAFTLGQLEQNRKRIIDDLEKRCLINKNKVETFLPAVIQRIGFITKEGSQAYFDFLKKLESSHLSFSLLFYQAAVQGRQVESSILKALNYFEHHPDKIDIVVIVRGGGARSDLSWFDNQKIAEAIANFPKPVLTGIGHKTDTSIADLVAYWAAPTPSSLADFITERNENYLQEIGKLAREISFSCWNIAQRHQQTIANRQLSIQTSIHKDCQRAFQNLEFLQKDISSRSYQYLKDQKGNILETREIIAELVKRTIRKAKETIEKYRDKITILDPINVMKRGFSLTTVNGKIIKGIQGLNPGEIMWTHLYQGKIKSRIENVKKNKKANKKVKAN